MKNYVKFLFPAMLCMTMYQTNVQGQMFKNALKKAKSAIGGSTKKAAVTNEAATVTKVEKEPTQGPAKPLAPDVKNSVSEMRAFTGLTKAELISKMKSKGFVEGIDEMQNQVYKSKLGDFALTVTYGTRGGASLVREILKRTNNKKNSLAKIKSNFLDFGKQCTDLKAEFNTGYLMGNSAFAKRTDADNAEERTSKFLPAFDTFISTKAEGNANNSYSETNFEYSINYFYTKGIDPELQTVVIDNTVASLQG